MLHEKLLKTIQKYNLIQKQDKIVIGVSGGPDSMCLLDSLYCLKEKLGFEIVVAHVNHMIRKEGDEETEFVKKIAKNLGIECYVKKVKGEEEAKKYTHGRQRAKISRIKRENSRNTAKQKIRDLYKTAEDNDEY